MWTVSIVSGMDTVYEKTDAGDVTKYAYANGLRIARMAVGGSTYYYHTDAFGSTWRMTDAAKGVVFSTAYEPFGRPWGTEGPLPAKPERYTFLGGRNDTLTGTTYLRVFTTRASIHLLTVRQGSRPRRSRLDGESCGRCCGPVSRGTPQ